MEPVEVQEYLQKLHRRAQEAEPLRRAEIEGGDWQPEMNHCHENVDIWCGMKPDFQTVRGWLYFDLGDSAVVRFVSHAAVRAPDGYLYDITPSGASRDYPFVESRLRDEEYFQLVEALGYGDFNYESHST